jgi:hypothetical protein
VPAAAIALLFAAASIAASCKQESPSDAAASVRRHGNRLQGERSLYLRQHARNPVDWYPWSEEALARARAEGKPIFLSIGYSACHWCHVMEREVFEREDVAAFLNQHFVSIKVDREERPDLDAVYVEAVLAMTGSAGWPLTVFLTPELKPFFGGTYFPRERFLEIAREIARRFRAQRSTVEAAAGEVAARVAVQPILVPGGALDAALFEAAVAQGWERFDREWGGLRTRMKFPTPVRWTFLLHRHRKTGDPRSATMVRRTLDAMATGGIRDHVGGGFHRYAVDREWVVPHFEKMLYDNAMLASLYLEAAAVFGSSAYAEAARDTLDFLLERMADPRGGFYASFDADSEGREGTYYVWTRAEIERIAGPRDGPTLAALLGVTPKGNFEGKSVLIRRTPTGEVASRLGRPEAEVAALFARWRPALRASRGRRQPPGLDRKIVTSWNGLAIAALAQGTVALGDERYRRGAEAAARRLWALHHRGEGRLWRASNDGVPGHEAVLTDYAFLANGLLELHQATGRERYLRWALLLIDHARRHFAHREAGFFLTRDDGEAPLGRKVDPFDGVRPSGSAALLHAMLRAGELAGRSEYRPEVEKTLRSYGDLLGRAGLDMAHWLDAAQKLHGPTYVVVVAGDPDSPRMRSLVGTFREVYPAHAALALVPPAGPAPGSLVLAAAEKVARDGVPTAYVCRHGSCKLPTSDPRTLRAQILDGWTR